MTLVPFSSNTVKSVNFLISTRFIETWFLFGIISVLIFQIENFFLEAEHLVQMYKFTLYSLQLI